MPEGLARFQGGETVREPHVWGATVLCTGRERNGRGVAVCCLSFSNRPFRIDPLRSGHYEYFMHNAWFANSFTPLEPR